MKLILLCFERAVFTDVCSGERLYENSVFREIDLYSLIVDRDHEASLDDERQITVVVDSEHEQQSVMRSVEAFHSDNFTLVRGILAEEAQALPCI